MPTVTGNSTSLRDFALILNNVTLDVADQLDRVRKAFEGMGETGDFGGDRYDEMLARFQELAAMIRHGLDEMEDVMVPELGRIADLIDEIGGA